MYVHPKTTCVVAYKGERVRLNPNQTWYADDPFVKAHPGFFADDPVNVSRSSGYRPVEQATAAPGEKRATRRSKPADADSASE